MTFAPSLDFTGGTGLRYPVSIDDQAPQIVNAQAGQTQAVWDEWVSDNANVRITPLHVAQPSVHTVKIWRVDPGLVFERVVIAARPLPRSYLGPPESHVAPPGASPEHGAVVDR